MEPDTEFVRRFVLLAEVLAEPLSEKRIAGYWAALSDLEPSDVWAAMDHALKTNPYFPRPAELRAYAEDLAQKRAERRRLEHPVVPRYQRLEPGDTPVGSERIAAFFAELRQKIKTMPGPQPPSRERRQLR